MHRPLVATWLLTAALAFPAVSAAQEYPGERAAASALVSQSIAIGQAFWHARGVSPCPAVQALIADSLEDADAVDAAGRGLMGGCTIFLAEYIVANAETGSEDSREWLCTVVTHELGHTAGLPDTATGVMGVTFTSLPWDCRRWGKAPGEAARARRRAERRSARALARARLTSRTTRPGSVRGRTRRSVGRRGLRP